MQYHKFGFSTYVIGCSMTFTEFEGKKKRYRNNRGPSSFAARTPNDDINVKIDGVNKCM